MLLRNVAILFRSKFEFGKTPFDFVQKRKQLANTMLARFIAWEELPWKYWQKDNETYSLDFISKWKKQTHYILICAIFQKEEIVYYNYLVVVMKLYYSGLNIRTIIRFISNINLVLDKVYWSPCTLNLQQKRKLWNWALRAPLH